MQVAGIMKKRKYSAVKQPQALMKCGTLISELCNNIIPADLHFQLEDPEKDNRQPFLK